VHPIAREGNLVDTQEPLPSPVLSDTPPELERHHLGYRAVDAHERVRLAQAFAARKKIVYGQAFDLVRVTPGSDVSFSDLDALTEAVAGGRVVLIEVKASRVSRTGTGHFGGHFFSVSTAELLVAQSLGDLYKFAFVNADKQEGYEVSLQQVYGRAKAIYPTWSIRLDDQEFPPDTAI
jgi:hypothetical protein